MAELPDISDLIRAEEFLDKTLDELEKAKKGYAAAFDKLRDARDDIVARYKSAGIPKDECDHPVIVYLGMGEDECLCCGEGRPQRKQR